VNLARILLIVAALAVAGVTAFLVKNFLDRKDEEVAQASAKANGNKVEAALVLVAERDLPTGTIIIRDHFRWQGWPKTAVDPAYILKKDKEKIDAVMGSAVLRAIAAGEPITDNKLIKPGEAGFMAGVLQPGMRAATLQVNPESGAAGFILPGNRVDVVMTQEVRQKDESGESSKKVVSETVLHDVRVLAVDQTLDDVEQKARLGKTVTLEVTPKQSEVLGVAKQMGRLTLVLRSLAKGDNVEDPTGFTSDEEVSRFLRVRSSAVPRILVAKHNLPAGTLLRDTDFDWLQLETGSKTDGMIVEAYTPEIALRGSFLKVAIEASQAIRSSDLIRPGEQGFIVAALSPGMRAVSVEVTQVTGVSGFAAPGDRVDIMLTQEVNDGSTGALISPRRFSETILRNMRLLAIEQTIDEKTAKPVIGQTVTLEATPREAESLALAASMGDLSLALRSVPSLGPEDEETSVVTDMAVSKGLRDFLIRGTRRNPDLVKHRAQIDKELGESKLPEGPALGNKRTIRVYRATDQSNVNVRR
jgi:pilus assembly protein CpaB